MINNVTPGLNEYVQVTCKYVHDNKEYEMKFNPAFVTMDFDVNYDEVRTFESDYPVRALSHRSATLNIANPGFTLTEKEISKVSIKHTMTMEVRGDVTTEDINTFIAQLPVGVTSTWTVKEVQPTYGGKKTQVFAAEWNVNPAPPVVEEDEEDDDDDDNARYCEYC